jgi:Zn-dependent protease with chaperone function
VTTEQFSKAGFLKSYVFPALFVLLIPGIGIWFAGYATRSLDGEVQENALTSIRQDTSVSPQDKEKFSAFYQETPASAICRGGTPQLNDLATALEDVCSADRQFGWIRQISWACIGIGLFAFLFASACVGVSLLSQRSLFASFLAGWHVLRIAALLQAVGQGMVLVMLSYWMTVVWFDRYVPKLIAVAGIGAIAVLWLIVKAIFARVDTRISLEGVVLRPTTAPTFWTHIREMCGKLSTEPPRHIVTGVDDNFFVTENPVMISGVLLEGRKLYISFSLLKVLEKSEADAILAHEMAHFSGDDTYYTLKMSPLLARYGQYLGALHSGGVLSRPLFHFMLLFWTLFQLSINRMSRQREFRADAIAAGATSPADMGRALIKSMAYSNYRSRIEQELFTENVKQEQVAIAGRVAAGFASYATSSSLLGDLSGRRFPHPFDSHPHLDARLAAVRAPLVPSHYAKLLTTPANTSWLSDIDGAEELERQMWKTYEDRFAAAHEEALAWRYPPSTDEERQIVEKYFPAVNVATKKADASLDIDFAQVRFSEWQAGVAYGDIKECGVRDSLGRKFLTIKLEADGKKVEIPLHRFANGDGVVALFERYSARHAGVRS